MEKSLTSSRLDFSNGVQNNLPKWLGGVYLFRCLGLWMLSLPQWLSCLVKLCVSKSKRHCPFRLVHISQDKPHPKCSKINSTDILFGSLWQPKQILVPKRALRNTLRNHQTSWRLKLSHGIQNNLEKWLGGFHLFRCFGLRMLSLPQRLSCYKVTSKVLG